MAGADDGGGRREPLVLGATGALIGVALAFALLMFGRFGDDGAPAGASSSPNTAVGSPAPSPSLVAAASAPPSVAVTAVPPTVAPPAPTATPSPTKTPEPTPTPNTDPAIVTWDAPKQEDCTNATGGMIRVSWRVARADGVSISIDGPGIYDSYAGLTGEVDLPFGCDKNVLKHTYTLRTIGGTGPVATETRTVKTRAPSIVSFVMGKPDCSGGGSVGINMSFEVRAATGAELRYDGALWSTYSVKTTNDIVLFNCDAAGGDQDWTLTTTGGYGPAASDSVLVKP